METSWTQFEEALTTETMRTGLGRIQAIHHLRRRWLIGESRPPSWKASRPMPRQNPRHGVTALQGADGSVESKKVIGTEVCAGCGSLFNPSRSNNRTCSDRCRKLASRRARADASEIPGKALSQAQ